MTAPAAQEYFCPRCLAKLLGVDPLAAAEGSARLRFEPRPEQRNGLGGVHGGVILRWPTSPLPWPATPAAAASRINAHIN